LARTRQVRDAIREKVEELIKESAGKTFAAIDFSLKGGKDK
jgi:hypothetical protein